MKKVLRCFLRSALLFLIYIQLLLALPALPSFDIWGGNGDSLDDADLNQAKANLSRFSREIKRLMGVKYRDVCQDKLISYDVRESDLSDPLIKLVIKGKEVYKYPEEVSADILKYMVKYAEDKTEATIKKAVITVPAHFNDLQRQATIRAAASAGLQVLLLLDEPIAAALSYVHKNRCRKENLLIYDLGGGTFDVCILDADQERIQVKATGGHSRLGGKDFDDRLIAYVIDEIKRRHQMDVAQDRITLRRLKRLCEDAKEKLTAHRERRVIMDALQGTDLCVNIPVTREVFEEQIESCLKKTIEIVDDTIKRADLSKEDVKEVLLVGGSSKIPAVLSALRKFFDDANRKIVKNPKRPEEAVAKGAAICAASSDQKREAPKKVAGVTPFSLGIGTKGGIMSVMIAKNTRIPTQLIKVYTTSKDNQDAIKISVFQGESEETRRNVFLGEFHITGITPLLAREVKIEVTMNVNENNMVEISAVERSRGKTKKLTLTTSDACAGQDSRCDGSGDLVEIVKLKNNFIGYCQEIIRLSEDSDYEIRRRCNELIRWARKTDRSMIDEIREKTEEVKRIYNSMRS